jgi:hypothetical protein
MSWGGSVEVNMVTSRLGVTFDIEPIVKVTCRETRCVFNLADEHGSLTCNLKVLNIGSGGRCMPMNLVNGLRNRYQENGNLKQNDDGMARD